MNRTYDPKKIVISCVKRGPDDINEIPKYNRKIKAYEWNGRTRKLEITIKKSTAGSVRKQIGKVAPLSITGEHSFSIKQAIIFELPKKSCKFQVWEVFQ